MSPGSSRLLPRAAAWLAALGLVAVAVLMVRLGTLQREAEQLRDALRRARSAQQDWGSRSVRDRARILRPVLDLMVERRDALAERISQEVGKPRSTRTAR